MMRRFWISPSFEVVDTGDVEMPPVGSNLLDAYRSGWVAVTINGNPRVEGKVGAIRLDSAVIANIIQEHYGLDISEVMQPKFDEYFQVVVVEYDDHGRPLGVKRVRYRDFMVERIPLGRFRRPEVRVRGYLRRRIVEHLESPPDYCLCKKSKTVDRVRRGLVRRLK